MPASKYDEFFGGAKGAADKALAKMKRTYGAKDGEHVFYATIAKRKRKRAGGKRSIAERLLG